jgi:tyrosine-protein phosphatase non-receptor type 23
LDVSNNVITSFKQMNPSSKQYPPIVLNCISGGSDRSGLMTLAISAIFATQMKKPTLLNVVDHWFRVCSQRKGVLDDESYLQLSLQIVLNNSHRILNKRGIMTSYQVKNAEKLSSPTETEKTVKDSLQELDPFWKFK